LDFGQTKIISASLEMRQQHHSPHKFRRSHDGAELSARAADIDEALADQQSKIATLPGWNVRPMVGSTTSSLSRSTYEMVSAIGIEPATC
jgi:hypothetical protein